jgi:hypothetical protein
VTEPDPSTVILTIANGHVVARCLHVVTELGIPDALGDEPASAAALAAKLGLNADALNRVMRLLASHGVFERKDDGLYAHTPASRLLRADDNRYIRSFVLMGADRLRWASYGELEHTVRTGAPAWDQVSPVSMWERLKSQPEESRIFNEAMTGKSLGLMDAVLNVYDFSRFGTIADIAGGRGHVLSAILNAAPNAKGVLFDQPHVLATVTPHERMTLHPGDFFKGGLPVCDAYVITDVLHDWSDEDTVKILKSIRQAAPPHAKLLIIEALVPGRWANVVDIHMMAYMTGRKRTGAEFAALSEAAGFRFERVIDAPPSYAIVESSAT